MTTGWAVIVAPSGKGFRLGRACCGRLARAAGGPWPPLSSGGAGLQPGEAGEVVGEIGQRQLRRGAGLADVLATADLTPRISALIDDLRQEWRELDKRIEALDRELMARAREDEAVRRLMTIPGVGVLTATALTAAIGKGEAITKGRHLAAWLGLVPRQASTGGRGKLLGIIKRGNRYLRQLFIRGARAALPHLAARDDAIGDWLRRLLSRVHFNVAVVGLANKLARMAWAVLAKGVVYRPQPAMTLTGDRLPVHGRLRAAFPMANLSKTAVRKPDRLHSLRS